MSARLTYANVMATIAVFIALGGAGYAATSLPRDSVGPKQLRADAVSSSKVEDRSLGAIDFKRGQLPRGRRGLQGLRGLQGVRGLQGDRGLHGVDGAPGPTSRTLDGQVDIGDSYHDIALGDGLNLQVDCTTPGGVVVYIRPTNPFDSFYGWGIASNGSTLSDVSGADSVSAGSGLSSSQVRLTAVARAGAPGAPIRYSHIDVSVIKGGACNYHILVIPPS